MKDNAVELFEMKVVHVGINADNAEEANEWAELFLGLMGFSKRETPTAYFSGELVEIMKQDGRGTKGHIGFQVNNCDQAIEYFAARGLQVIEETKKINAAGSCTFAYFEREIGGFAIHLTQV